MNLSLWIGAPVFASKPFFLDGDPQYPGNLSDNYLPRAFANRSKEGNHDVWDVPLAVRDLYDTYIDIEPTTGTTYRVAKRLQLSVHAFPVKGLEGFEKLQEVYLPIMYVSEEFTMSDAVTDQYKASLGLARQVQHYYFFIGQIVGGVILAGVVVALARGHTKTKQAAPTAPHEDERAPLLRGDSYAHSHSPAPGMLATGSPSRYVAAAAPGNDGAVQRLSYASRARPPGSLAASKRAYNPMFSHS